jgi:N-acetyl-anhydromuramyl-L-alanine amidase AmpD
MDITNLINVLPWHPTKRWAVRTKAAITTVVVHQAASAGTLENINKYHITPTVDRDGDGDIDGWEKNHVSPTGCPHICYTYAIRANGEVCQCNNLTDVTWHVKNANSKAIGILVCGNFNGPGWSKGGEPSPAQIDSLQELLQHIHTSVLPAIPKNKYFGHCELQAKPACPGTTLMQTLKSWRES